MQATIPTEKSSETKLKFLTLLFILEECVAELDRYLKQYANKNHVTGVAKTFVALPTDGNQVIGGYYSCNATGIKPEQLPADLRERLPGYLTPAILIGKLAVERSMQGRGLGTRLLIHAFENIIEVSEKIGVYAVRVDANSFSD